MTQKEFETRLGIVTSEEVFNKYNAVYMSSELEKDEYCSTLSPFNVTFAMLEQINLLKQEIAYMKGHHEKLYKQLNDAHKIEEDLRKKLAAIRNITA